MKWQVFAVVCYQLFYQLLRLFNVKLQMM